MNLCTDCQQSHPEADVDRCGECGELVCRFCQGEHGKATCVEDKPPAKAEASPPATATEACMFPMPPVRWLPGCCSTCSFYRAYTVPMPDGGRLCSWCINKVRTSEDWTEGGREA